MNCNDFERELESLVENRADRLSQAAEQHRASCAACAGLWREHAMLQAAVKVWRHQTPEVDLTGPVLAELQRAPAERVAPSRRRLMLAGSAIAVAAAAVLFAVGPRWESAPPVGSVAVVEPGKLVASEDDVDLTESVVELWEDVKDSTPGLPQAALPKLPHVERVWPVLASHDEPAVEEATPSAASSSRASVSTVVRDRVASAFGFLGQTLPAEPRGS